MAGAAEDAATIGEVATRGGAMERVPGIGGVFFRSGDPEGLAAWYEQHLGVNSGLQGEESWQQEAGPMVWAPFPQDSDYFGRPEQQVMVNFRVRNLDAMLEPDLSCGNPTTDGKSASSSAR